MKKGFTLLEILLVIAAIGILATIVIVAINPQRQLRQVNEASVRSQTNALFKALQQYFIDNGGYPVGVTDEYQEVCDSGDSSTPSCGGYLDLSNLVPTYIASIPKHYRSVNGAGYLVSFRGDNQSISVVAPHIIRSVSDFFDMNDSPRTRSFILGDSSISSYHLLINDLDFSGVSFTPIGTDVDPFEGVFNGNGFSLQNISYSEDGMHKGPFGYINGGVVENVFVNGLTMNGNMGHVGGVVGSLYFGEVRNAHVINSTINVGYNAGGVVGFNAGRVYQSSADVQISADYAVAGVVGNTAGGTAIVQECFSKGTVTYGSAGWAGGIIGNHTRDGASPGNPILIDSYSRSVVTGNPSEPTGGRIGGAIGSTFWAYVDSSYSTGAVTPSNNGPTNGFVGRPYFTLTQEDPSYFDQDTSGLITGGAAIALTTAQMQQQSSFSGWDFVEIWSIDGVTNDGYPYLQWQDEIGVY